MQSETSTNIRSWIESILETAAGFVDEQPLLASVAAVVLVALLLYALAKLARVAMVAVVVVALLCGVLVYYARPGSCEVVSRRDTRRRRSR